jgi:hypothetical protein
MRQAHQAINLLVQRSKDLRTGSNDSVPQGFEVALEVGEWRAQLVGRIDDELATQALLFLQLSAIWLKESASEMASSGPWRGTRA